MRTISSDDNALFTAVGGRGTFVRVDVQDSGGTWRDLTTYPGVNMVLSATWRDSMDDNGQNGEVVLKREQESLSLSPLMTGSPLNNAFAFPGTYASLLAVKRGVCIYTADVPTGQKPGAADWRLMFEGKIDSVDAGTDENVTLALSDAQGDLRDLFIETERIYAYAQGTNATKGCLVWTPLMTTAAGDLVVPTEANRNGHFYKASGGVALASPEPIWPTGSGATVSDGTNTWTEAGATSTTSGIAVETVMNQIIADNGGSDTINVPGGSPGWNITWYLQQRQSIWDAIRALTDQIGWDLRYKFDAGSGTFKLCLWSPDRSSTTVLRTFGPADVLQVSELKIDVANIRNAVGVVFSQTGVVDPAGNPLRIPVVEADSGSITKYGRRYMEMGEASTSNIDTTTEAQTMALAALSDLKEPNAEKQVVLPYFPFVELADLDRFSADGIYADGNLDLAVMSYEHTVTSEGDNTTTLVCRGKPSTGTARWLGRGSEVNSDDIHRLSLADADGVALSASSVVGGTLLQASSAYSKHALGQDMEWHIGSASNFTPDSTTLLQGQGGNQATAPHLIPNKIYYAKIVPVRRNASRIVRGQPSAALSFTAGRAAAGHLNEGLALARMPLNGGFEDRSDPNNIFDHWYLLNGAYPTNFDVKNDANGVSGANYLKVISSASLTKIRSALCPLVNDDSANTALRLTQRYLLSCWVKTDSGNSGANNLLITAAGVDYQGNLIGNMGGSGTIAVSATSQLGKWQRLEAIVHSDGFSTMKAVYVYVSQDTNGVVGTIYYVDEISIVPVGSPWYIIGQTTKFTDNLQSVPAFANSWVADVTAPAFRREPSGHIELKGSMKNGTIGSKFATSPIGFRPAEAKRFPVICGFSTLGELDIATNGDMTVASGSNSWVSLDGIRFWPYL